MKKLYLAAALLALVLFVVQVGMGAKAAPKKGPSAANGKTLYKQKGCIPCHGEKGDGNGSVGKMLKPKPTNFTDAKAMAKRKDAVLFKAIKSGGKAVGKSAAMPAYGDKMSSAQIKDTVAFIRTFAKKKK